MMCLVHVSSTPGTKEFSNQLTIQWNIKSVLFMLQHNLYKPVDHLSVEHFLLTSLDPQAWGISTPACEGLTCHLALHKT